MGNLFFAASLSLGHQSVSEFDLMIYVNGDNNLENLRQPDHTWKVRLIEMEVVNH